MSNDDLQIQQKKNEIFRFENKKYYEKENNNKKHTIFLIRLFIIYLLGSNDYIYYIFYEKIYKMKKKMKMMKKTKTKNT